jgi:hypothetical protein
MSMSSSRKSRSRVRIKKGKEHMRRISCGWVKAHDTPILGVCIMDMINDRGDFWA